MLVRQPLIDELWHIGLRITPAWQLEKVCDVSKVFFNSRARACVHPKHPGVGIFLAETVCKLDSDLRLADAAQAYQRSAMWRLRAYQFETVEQVPTIDKLGVLVEGN